MATPAPARSPNTLQNSELILSGSLLALLVVFLVPLPTIVLDLLLAINLSITVLLLLVTITVKQPLDFSTFPSLLLLLTLFRLGLNVATTRLILLNGDAGEIVLAFGKFVVGGNLIVGLVIFAILIVIQFVVITKGSGRVSEVAARFTLDAMPGKQMAIDAEMNAGLIDEPEARRRRQMLMRESEFYGTMDGASKFVRGDAIAAVLITGVNLIGGIIIGLVNGSTVMAAVNKYSILTIGDGLITQIPALITATASGLLVTKASSTGDSLGQELGGQVKSSVAPLRLGAFIVFGMALIPGLPKVPFLVLGALLFFAARRMTAQAAAVAATASSGPSGTPGAKAEPAKTPLETYADEFLSSDRIGLEIGTGLIGMVSSRRGTSLVDRIGGLRRDIAKQNGLWVPSVRVRDNIQLEAQTYRVLLGGREVARGSVRPDLWLAIDSSGSGGVLQIDGEPAREPAFGLPAKWISDADRGRAEMNGYTVVDAASVLITHLGEVVRRHAHELLGRDDLKGLLDKVRETSPAVVDDLIPVVMPAAAVHRVLTLLLQERVPITNLVRILESLASHGPTIKDPAELTERVRADLGRTICDRFRDPAGRVRSIVFDPRLEIELRRAVQGGQLQLDYGRLEQLTLRLRTEQDQAAARGADVAVLCDSSMRRALRSALVRTVGDLAVVAYQEIPTDMLMDVVAVIRPDELTGNPTTLATAFESAGK